jgi:hypothetical protein
LADDENDFASESEASFNFERQNNRFESNSLNKNISWLDNAKIRFGNLLYPFYFNYNIQV